MEVKDKMTIEGYIIGGVIVLLMIFWVCYYLTRILLFTSKMRTTNELGSLMDKNPKLGESKDLMGCPFCGSEAFIWIIPGSKLYKISCKNDCVTMPPRFDMGFTSEEQAKKYWNCRYFPTL
ncbi:hypothetical protein A2Z67_04780 [Candidatus Woesebacteria bacterium RBG_13_36_22]|uniref:Uncharacterized protein n=1 Tax=Candidatus Woesebacteria bacterium RBG_13_36_22 TaxID=1802478 RepID=A0A1F7X4K3_9BACT|nr:MAG: hypothetical protein A2Z67_04780 [Candidatus Woesebacteria bacterium RBG_13_36_22]